MFFQGMGVLSIFQKFKNGARAQKAPRHRNGTNGKGRKGGGGRGRCVPAVPICTRAYLEAIKKCGRQISFKRNTSIYTYQFFLPGRMHISHFFSPARLLLAGWKWFCPRRPSVDKPWLRCLPFSPWVLAFIFIAHGVFSISTFYLLCSSIYIEFANSRSRAFGLSICKSLLDSNLRPRPQ